MVLDRYCSAAAELAESTFLGYPTMMTIRPGASIEDEVERAYPPMENIRGFSVLLRQFHSKDELASFPKMRALLGRLDAEAEDAHSTARREQLGAWGRAVGQARMHQVKALVRRRLERDRGWTLPKLPDENQSPEQLLSLYNYGEDIHWGRKRETLAALGVDPLEAAMMRMHFFEAATGLAHLYLGFAVLVEAALPAEPGPDCHVGCGT